MISERNFGPMAVIPPTLTQKRVDSESIRPSQIRHSFGCSPSVDIQAETSFFSSDETKVLPSPLKAS